MIEHGFPKRELLISFLVFAVILILFNQTDLDFILSDKAFAVTSFESCQTLTFLAYAGKYSCIAFSIVLLINVFIGSIEKPTRRYEAIFCLTVLITGPGIINNLILKPTFNRPRPYEINRYDKEREKFFVPVLNISGNNKSRSFPSGHAGAGFFFLTPWFIHRLREKYRWKLFLPAFLWGGAVSFVRILQGQHFFSDCIGSLMVVYLTSLTLSYFFRLHRI